MPNYYILQGDRTDRYGWNCTVWDALPQDYDYLTVEEYEERFPPVLPPEPPEPTPEEIAAQEEAEKRNQAQEFLLGMVEGYNG